MCNEIVSLQCLWQAHCISSGICITHWLRMDHSTCFHSLPNYTQNGHRQRAGKGSAAGQVCSKTTKTISSLGVSIVSYHLFSLLGTFFCTVWKSKIFSWPLPRHTPHIFTQLPTSTFTILHYFIITYLHIVKFLDWNSRGEDHI